MKRRSRTRRFGWFEVAVVVLGVASLAMLFDEDARLAGIAGVMLFVVMPIAILAAGHRRPAPSAPGDPSLFLFDRGELGALAVVALAFVVIFAILALDPTSFEKWDAPGGLIRIVAVAGLVLFGIVGLPLWRGLVIECRIRIGDDELEVRAPSGSWTVPWSEVTETGLFTAWGQRFLGLRLRDRRSIQASPAARFVWLLERPFMKEPWDAWCQITALKGGSKALLTAIRMRAADAPG